MASAEEEVFEIVDFTSASEWESFTSKLEEILLAWQLSLKDKEEVAEYTKQKLDGNWKELSEDINFAGYPFVVTHHWVENDIAEVNPEAKGGQVFESLMDEKNDFPSGNHSCGIARFYGLSEFVVVCPSGNEMLTSESRIHLVLSSITIAVNNIQCRVPVFVQVHERRQQLFQGIFESKNLRTDFQMVHLRRIPPSCRHLSGLLEIFKEKIGSSSRSERASVSVCWTYNLTQLLDSAEKWLQNPPDFDHQPSKKELLGPFPFGASKDPIKDIRVSSIWSSLNEDIVVDSEVYTDLDPMQAPLWTVHVELNDEIPTLLVKTLYNFLDLCLSGQTTEQLLGGSYTVLQSPDSPEYEQALGALTKEKQNYSKKLLKAARRAAGNSKKSGGPIPEESLVIILNFLFPDAEGDASSQSHPYGEQFQGDYPSALDSSWKDSFSAFKTTPVDSLIHRLATVAVHTVRHFNGIEGLAHLWHEIVLELRFRWENGYIIPGLDSGTPDLNYCRLYQKFQMLNCCINHKKSNCAGGPPATAIPPEEDEFFDAEEEVEEAKPTHSAWNQPQGRKERTKMKLLNSPTEWIYAPMTQDPLPMTEDMLEEQTEMMEQLGSDAEASELRARILSASLLSDMEAFKAANPGSVIEDFVRWHSPRDWIDDEDNVATDESKSGGHLSGRMQSPGNLWLEMWKAAKPVPSWRQKRLFDDTKEAEKILHTFSSLKPGQIAKLMIPAVFHASTQRLLEELLILPLDDSNPMDLDVKSNCKSFITKIGQITRHRPLDLEQYEDALTILQQSEIRLSQFKSLKLKLAGCQEAGAFAARLMSEPDGVPLLGGSHSAVGSVLHKALENSVDKSGRGEQQQPVPSRKEFILRCTAHRPGNGSTSSCQRMYCCIDQDSYRLAGAFTQDTLFF